MGASAAVFLRETIEDSTVEWYLSFHKPECVSRREILEFAESECWLSYVITLSRWLIARV